MKQQISFDSLLAEFESRLGVEDVLTPQTIDHTKMIALMESYTSEESDWEKYAYHDSSRSYTRNGVENFGHNANLLLLVWEPGKGSLVHDHAAAHCVMKVLKGHLQEYLFSSETLKLESKRDLGPDSVAYITDELGYHKMVNESSELAVSLHLYTPPYAKLNGCNIIDEVNGSKVKVNMSRLHSYKGVLMREGCDTC
ncbi:unnamed protein product [Kuraishia capsulata CBS 1993]|uniref:Cysteine dioxygenase n=1 Tax=Kuraishia capsulata CBS 1993 TaxID=1382522 RepID=W6MPE3_9ASCO|nr:uncharacterized protein KUCA_T00002964001 [Kuraishia capsulata CBS 1993]CDK26987.1 unnamed protein product [Kuraishia capsulata CBS 1993]